MRWRVSECPRLGDAAAHSVYCSAASCVNWCMRWHDSLNTLIAGVIFSRSPRQTRTFDTKPQGRTMRAISAHGIFNASSRVCPEFVDL